MRRFLKWVVVTVGVTALVRWLRRRGAEPEVSATAPADPAEELRQKLAESREPEASAEEPPAPETTVEERRVDVHEQGRTTIDEMTPSDEG